MPFNLLVTACLVYVLILFTVAFVVESRARAGRLPKPQRRASIIRFS